jgi:superfamily II DNA or RNA helicase
MKTRWDPYNNEPIAQASGLCYILRKIVNSDESRQVALLEILEKTPRAIVFYSYDYELDILLNLSYSEGTHIAQYNGHIRDPLPTSDRWLYFINYASGAEGWNCITTDTIIFYSQTYSYKTLAQATGRIDRLTTPYRDLYYYHLKTRSGIDLAISKALKAKKKFNETKWAGW